VVGVTECSSISITIFNSTNILQLLQARVSHFESVHWHRQETIPYCGSDKKIGRISGEEQVLLLVFFLEGGRNSPQWARASSITRFLDHT